MDKKKKNIEKNEIKHIYIRKEEDEKKGDTDNSRKEEETKRRESIHFLEKSLCNMIYKIK